MKIKFKSFVNEIFIHYIGQIFNEDDIIQKCEIGIFSKQYILNQCKKRLDIHKINHECV